jgi:molybdenum-dependent DNA-binding transcriptional regulator ModE/transposase
MWQLIDAGHSRTGTAATLGTSIEHVRLIAARHPRPAPQPRPAHNTKIPRAGLARKDELRRYHDQGMSQRDIAKLTGVSPQLARQLLAEAGITPRPPGSHAVQQRLDPDWFTSQYVTRRKTLGDISREVHISPHALARYAHHLGITPRRGGAGHRNPLHDIGTPADVPPPIWAAFQRSGGHHRIRRFLTIIKHPSLAQASRQLSTSPSVLSTQIAQLEHDLGTQLITRNPGHRGFTVTAEGRRFARDARLLLTRIDRAASASTPQAKPSWSCS